MPTLVLCTGFDHGVNSATSLIKGNGGIRFADVITGTPAITSSTPRTGGFCLEISAAAAAERLQWDTNTLGAAGNVMVVGFGLRFVTALPTADTTLHVITTTSATIDLHLSFRNSDDKLIINTSTGSGTAAVSANAVVADTWYWIDLRFTISGTSWTADWAIDEVPQTQFTHTAPTTDQSTNVTLGSNSVMTITARYDDLLVSKTSGDYPLGPHKVRQLTADTGATATEIGTGNATSRFINNSTADATFNSANILAALAEGPPPTLGGSASGVCQRVAGVGNAAQIPMTTYTLAAGETFSGMRVEAVGWSGSATTNSYGLRVHNGTTEDILQAAADLNFDADTAAPAWLCKMVTAANYDTQGEIDAFNVRVGYSNGDVNPLPGFHAIYAALAVKEATSTPITLTDTAAGDDALTVSKVDENQWPPQQFPQFAPPFIGGHATPFQLLGDRTAAGVASVSLDDTATATDAATITAAVPLADTATATDALSLAVASPLADTAVASDSLALAAAVPLAETATTAEDLAAGVPISLADTATATDSLSISVTLPLADTATATDAIGSIAVPITLADTATATDALLLPPQLLTGLALWFRADDFSGLADGAAVTSWTSLAGTSVASQATGGLQPTKQTDTGETVVRFDGTDDRLLLNGDALTALQNAANATVFLRVKSSASGIFLSFSNGLSSASSRFLMRRLSGLWNVGGRRLDTDSIQSVGYQAIGSSVDVATATVDWGTANIDVYVDGIPRGSSAAFQTAGNTSNTASIAAAIGSAASEDNFATVDIYEIVVAVGTIPTAVLRRTVEQYMGVSDAVIGLDDDATTTETLTSPAAIPLTETATATDALSLPQNEPDAYQAPIRVPGMFIDPEGASFQLQGSTAPSNLASITLTDTAAATDALTSTATVLLADTASAADALAVTVALALADTASAVDLLAAGVPISLAETASAADSLAITVALALADTATATDAISIPEAPAQTIESRVATGDEMFRLATGLKWIRHSYPGLMFRIFTGTNWLRVSTADEMFRVTTTVG